MISSVPWNRPRCIRGRWAAARCPAADHCGSLSRLIPFPLATSKCRPSGVTRTEVGYQPTGMKRANGSCRASARQRRRRCCCRVGHEQCLSVRRKRQGCSESSAAANPDTTKRSVSRTGFPVSGIKHGHAVSPRRIIRDVRNISLGMFLGRPAGDELVGVQVDDCHGCLRPEADVEALSFLVQPAGIRKRRFVRYNSHSAACARLIAAAVASSTGPVGGAGLTNPLDGPNGISVTCARIVQVQSQDALGPTRSRRRDVWRSLAQRQVRGYAAFLHVAPLLKTSDQKGSRPGM